MNTVKIAKILEDHDNWRNGKEGGVCANLNGASLRGASFGSARGIISIEGGDLYTLFVIQQDDGLRFKAGCRWFTLSEARHHWTRRHHNPIHAQHMVVCVEALVALATLHGWEVA